LSLSESDTLPRKGMFLRYNTRKKDGKVHRYWSSSFPE